MKKVQVWLELGAIFQRRNCAVRRVFSPGERGPLRIGEATLCGGAQLVLLVAARPRLRRRSRRNWIGVKAECVPRLRYRSR